jgi:Tfp pilus assembly protein PilP
VIRRAAAGTAFALALAACGGGAPPPLPAAAPTRPAPAAADQGQQVAEKPLPAITYEAKGLRDPFEPLEVTAGAKGLTVSSTRLTGIVRSRRGVFALLEGSDGLGYILRPGDTLGDGRLVEIDAGSAVFTVVARPGAPPNRVTLRLRTDS